MKRRLAAAAAALVATAAQSSEPYRSGDLVYDICSGDDGPAPNCNIYIAGVVDGIAFSRPSQVPAICVPADAEPDALARAVWAFVTHHPYRPDIDGPQIIVEAAAEAFPCP